MPQTYVFSVPVGPAHIDRLPQTLRSLAAQPVPVKVALCDASGSDACKAIADAFPELIAYRRHGPDKGQSDAINEGWAALDGDVYSWLNADDYLAPNALGITERVFEQNEDADIVYGQSLILEEDGSYIGLHPAVGPQIDLITRSNIISQPSCFYRKELLDALGPVRPELDYTMDWELWVRFFKASKRFAYTPKVLSTVLWERGTKTSSVNRHRMREIRKLTATSHGPFVQMKTMIGFYLHYFSEYSRLAPIIGPALGWGQTRKMQRRSHWVAIDPSPEQDQAAAWTVDFHHFADQPMNQMELKFFEPCHGSIAAGGTEHQLDGTHAIILDIPLDSGASVTLEFSGSNLVPGALDRIIPRFAAEKPAK